MSSSELYRRFIILERNNIYIILYEVFSKNAFPSLGLKVIEMGQIVLVKIKTI